MYNQPSLPRTLSRSEWGWFVHFLRLKQFFAANGLALDRAKDVRTSLMTRIRTGTFCPANLEMYSRTVTSVTVARVNYAAMNHYFSVARHIPALTCESSVHTIITCHFSNASCITTATSDASQPEIWIWDTSMKYVKHVACDSDTCPWVLFRYLPRNDPRYSYLGFRNTVHQSKLLRHILVKVLTRYFYDITHHDPSMAVLFPILPCLTTPIVED